MPLAKFGKRVHGAKRRPAERPPRDSQVGAHRSREKLVIQITPRYRRGGMIIMYPRVAAGLLKKSPIYRFRSARIIARIKGGELCVVGYDNLPRFPPESATSYRLDS